MRREPFVKSSPSGNVTILVRDASLSVRERANAAAELMDAGHLAAEQVGFVDTYVMPPRLDMMGGEFCMNATRSFAALLYGDGLLEACADGWFRGTVSVSGMNEPVQVRVRGEKEDCEAFALIDLPGQPPMREVSQGIYEVRVPGIVHLVLDESIHSLPSDWEQGTRKLFGHFQLMHEEAAGCIWLRRENTGTALSLTPFVRVRETDTTCAETACGSGTLAAAVVLWSGQGQHTPLSVRQPGGDSLLVLPERSRFSGGWAAWVGGTVHTVASGEAFVRCLDCVPFQQAHEQQL